MTVQSKLSASSEVIGSVEDLLTLILLCLPVKSLMRFKLVSQKWKSLITSHCFSLQYYPEPNPAIGMFYYGISAFGYAHFDVQNPDPPFRELKFGEDRCPFWIHHSCNGLLLCSSTRNLDYDSNGESSVGRFYIYNPTINCSRKLPRPGVVNGVPKIVCGLSLAFDPVNSPSGKVVCVRESELAPDLRQIEIFSPESDEWTVSSEPFRSKASFDDVVYWNGAIHWINHVDSEVLFFSVDQERLGKISIPSELDGHEFKYIGYFGESCDHLHLILNYNTGANLIVYEMKRDHSDWFVKYKVDLKASIGASFSVIGILFPDIYSLIRSKNGSPFLVMKIHDTVISFNLDGNTFEVIYKFGDGEFAYIYRAREYIESIRMF